MVHNQLSEGAISNDLKATHPHECLILCSRYDDLGVTQAAIDVHGEGPCTEQDISAAPQVNGVYEEVKETIDTNKKTSRSIETENMLSKGIGVSPIKGDVVSLKRGLQGLSE